MHAPCLFGSTEDITEERMTTSGSWMPQLLVLSPRSGGPFKEATGRIQKRQPTTARPVPWANSGRFRRGFVPITCLAVLDLGLPEGRSLGPTLGGREGPWAWLITSSLCWSRVHAPGLVLPLGAKVDSKQTPSQGKASSDRFDPGSFFLPCFGRAVWAKAAMLHIYGLASVWEVPCSRLTGGDGHARLTTGSW